MKFGSVVSDNNVKARQTSFEDEESLTAKG